jgi:hypothetical protein
MAEKYDMTEWEMDHIRVVERIRVGELAHRVSSKPGRPRASSSGPAGRSRPATPRSTWCARSSRFPDNARSTTGRATNGRWTRLVHGNTGPDTRWMSLPA